MNLFQLKKPKLNSGEDSEFKIECEALTDGDWNSISFLLSEKLPNFKRAIGVPRGGNILAEKMSEYATDKDSLPTLICDDVLTTSGSMSRFRTILETTDSYGGSRYSNDKIIGAVAFSRGKCPQWITPLLRM
jgi:hypothetical protein|tara:strand:- start:3333 stop:3728 length:396 start_codon:yes stop_codon:yes gene_type:complete